MSKKENKKKNEELKDEEQLTIQELNGEDKIESLSSEIESNENSDADYIHDESIVSDEEFKKQLKEKKYKDKLKQKEIYRQYKKDKKERKKINKDALKEIKDKQEKRNFKVQKHEEELNIRSELGVKTPGERFSLYFRKTVLSGSVQTALLVLILVTAYITINLYGQQGKLPKIDVTADKVYSLTDNSKEYIKTIEDDVRLYSYGYDEGSYICDLLKQYDAQSDHITYEFLDGNSNPQITTKYNLISGNQVIIVETDVSSKQLIYTDLRSYDSITGDEIDTTENAVTNAIYSTLSTNRPNVYYLTGHSDVFVKDAFQSANAILSNDGFNINELNIIQSNKIPSDCDLIIIPSTSSDLIDKEADIIKNYINNGGNLLIMSTFNDKKPVSGFKNLKSIIDIYGASIDNTGIVVEQDISIMGSTYFVLPELNKESSITKPLYDAASYTQINTFVSFYVPGKIELPSEDKQKKDKLVVTTLANSSEKSLFVKDNKQTVGSNVLAAMITKTIKEGSSEEDTVKSSVVLLSDTYFCSDYKVTIDGYETPLSVIGKNIDLFTNSIAGLTHKEDFMSIRKTIYTTTFTPTSQQNAVVVMIVTFMPLIIIITGVIIKIYRNKKN